MTLSDEAQKQYTTIMRWAMTLAILFGTFVFASCTTATPPAASEKTTQSSKPDGTLTYGWSDAAAGRISDEGYPFMGFGSAVFDNLLRLNADGQPVPGIAERWDISPDGLTQTFYIRKGVKFHNGDDLTAADVRFSLERVSDAKLVPLSASERTAWNAQIASLELKDDYTLVVHLKQAQFEVPLSFNQPARAATVVLPKKYIGEKGEDYFQKNPIGSGPWKLTNYQEGVRVDLEANESYWGEVPKFKNLKILVVLEEAAKVAMLRTGELDLAAVTADSVAGLKAAGLRIVPHDGSSQVFVSMFYDPEQRQKYAMNDINVRKALSFGINRKEMGDQIFGGYAEPAALYRVVKTAYFFDPNVLKPDSYDPEQAKKLLAQAGYTNGFDLKIWNTAGGVVNLVNQAMSGYWRKIGINAQLANIDYSVFRPLTFPVVKPDVYGTVWSTSGAGNVWQDESLRASFPYPGIFQQKKIEGFNEIIQKLPLTKDPAEKKRMALEAAVLLKNDYNVAGLVSVNTLFALGSKVGGFTPIKGAATYLGPVYGSITHAK